MLRSRTIDGCARRILDTTGRHSAAGLVLALAVLAAGAATGLAQPSGQSGTRPGGFVDVEPHSLGVGDPAPALAIGQWIKGEPIESFVEGRVYAIEFWATWCGPCIAGIPHLSEVQEKHKDHLDIVSVTSADPSNTLEAVTEFVAARDSEMGYRVAFDDLDRTSTSYMQAAGQNGIPCAFVIDKQGRVAWIGHPADPAFEGTIEAIIRDEFDPEAAVRERKLADERRARLEAAQRELHDAWNTGETEKAFALADEIVGTDPQLMSSWAWWKFESLMVGVGEPARGQAYAKELMLGPYREDAQMLMRLAYGIADSIGVEGADLDLALDIAERAVALRLGQDSQTLATLAMVRLAREEYDEAVEVMQRAVDVAQTPEMRRHLENELEFYKFDRDMAARQKSRENE